MAANLVPSDFLRENSLNLSDAPERIISNSSFAEETVKSTQDKRMSSPEEISGLSQPLTKTDNSGMMADHINVIQSIILRQTRIFQSKARKTWLYDI